MFKIFKTNWVFLLVLVFASILRLWNLGLIPPGLTPDEVSLGYNAYSILKTGKDEYGKVMPVIFKSFGDFKPGLYIYTSVPFVAVLGLNEFGVRLPNAIAGIIAVWLLYLIVKKMFKDERLAVISGLFLAISPWHIQFSRGAWEVNLSLTLTLCGIYFFLRALEKQKFLILSALFFALTLITYQGAKLSTGIVVLLLLVVYRKEVFSFKAKTLIVSTLIGVFISLPIILSFFNGQTGRLNVFSIFSYPRPKEYLETILGEGGEKVGDVTYYLFHSEGFSFLRTILLRYFNHFSGRFLFFEGDFGNPRHSAPNSGMLLLGDIALLVFGVISFIKYGFKKESIFVWVWLLLSPLPAALSRDQVHAIRAYHEVIPLTIILAFGLSGLAQMKNKFIKAGFGILYLAGFIYFLDAYFVHLPAHNSQYWGYGYKQIVEAVTPIQGNYKQIKIQKSFEQPYIYFLFYQKYDPAKYQAQAKLTENENRADVGQVEKLDNICFCAIDWSINRGDHGMLIVADPIRMPYEDSKDEKLFKLVKEIKYLNGKDTAFRIVEVK